MADTALEYLPMSGAPSDGVPGRKVFFPIPLKHNPHTMEDLLYIFAESKLPEEPRDKSVGFTEEDIINTTGIYLFNRSAGNVFALETLFREVITDLSLQNRVTHRLNEMKRMVHLDETFLEAANSDRSRNQSEKILLN